MLVAGLLAGALAAPSRAHGCHVPEPKVGAGATASCHMDKIGALEVSETAGLGRMEIHGKTAAILGRDEGIVSLVDVSKPAKPKVLGRYDGGLEQQRAGKSLDGDLAFSSDGKWLFYARQSTQMSGDGVHVIDVSDPSAPTLLHYQPQGGASRIAVYDNGSATYVITLDAVQGLVVNRFDPTDSTGALVPVFAEPTPALTKVGGPASAGLFVDAEDEALGLPLLYAAAGDGLHVYDLSAPEQPALVGSWDSEGLAEIEVVSTKKSRTIYTATEYWFETDNTPEVIVLDASDLSAIDDKRRIGLGFPATDEFRVQGMSLTRNRLFVAYSQAGLIAFDLGGHSMGYFSDLGAKNAAATVATAGPYAYDVESTGKLVYVTDAASGTLTVVRPGRG